MLKRFQKPLEKRIEKCLESFHNMSRDNEICSNKEIVKNIMQKFPQALIYATRELQEDDELLDICQENTAWALDVIGTKYNNEECKARDRYLLSLILKN